MMKINKCSLTGIAVNIDADNPYELLEQTSYYPVNFYELGADDYYNNGWYPSKITFSDFSNYAMACYPGSTNISEIKYVFDIKDAGDYIFAFKLHKRFGFNPITTVVVEIEFPKIDILYFSSRLSSVQPISLTIDPNMAQGIEDSVWVTMEYPILIPGRYTVSIIVGGPSFRYIPSFTSIFFVEAVTGFAKNNFTSSGLGLTNENSNGDLIVRCYRPNSIGDSHPLSAVSFNNTLKQGQARICAQFAYANENEFTLLAGFCSFPLESFDHVARSVNSKLPNVLNISDEKESQLCIIFSEHYSSSKWNFSYCNDESAQSGSTFVVNSDEELDLQLRTIAADVYVSDDKVKVVQSDIAYIKLSESLIIPYYNQKYNIVVSPPVGKESDIADITDDKITENLKDNFALYSDSSYPYYSLSLPDRHQSFVLDHSGSMSWSDHDGVRFDLVNSVLDKFDSIYPGNMTYSLVVFNGTPVIVQWFGSLERNVTDTNDPDAIRAAFLANKFTNYRGCHIVRKKNVAPLSPTDGDIVFNGYDKVLYDTGLEEGVIYYYAIYPIDSSNRLGKPQIVRAYTRSGSPVRGIKSLAAKELIGTGVRKDDRCIFVYHMNESSGNKIYDFSGNRLNLDLSNSAPNSFAWLDEAESPPVSSSENVGKGSGLRLTGSGSYSSWSGSISSAFDGLNFSAWIYPFSGANNDVSQLLKISGEKDSLSFSYDINYVYVYVSSILVAKLNHNCSFDNWSHISINFSQDLTSIEIYVNGQIHDTSDVSFFSTLLSSFLNSSFNAILLGHTEQGGFVGRVSEISMRNSLLSHNEIATESSSIPKDNGDRLLVLSWFTQLDNNGYRTVIKYRKESGVLRLLDEDIAGPANYGQYQGDSTIGNPPNTPAGRMKQSDLRARICYGDDIGPVSSDDGVTVYDSDVDGDVNEWTFIDEFTPAIPSQERFQVNAPGFRHFFRIFRINADGEQSIPDDSGMLEYTTASYDKSDVLDLSIMPVSNLSAVPGDRKIKLSWSYGSNSSINSVIVYYSNIPIPTDFLSNRQSGGSIYPIYAGSIEDSMCVHHYGRVRDSQRRIISVDDSSAGNSLQGALVESEDDLVNGKIAYYAVVSRDRYGELSEPVFVSQTPSAADNDKNIPPEKVLAARAYGVDFETISLKWINPVSASRFYDIEGWLDDNVVLYFKVTDIYGKRVDDQSEFEISFRFNDYLKGLVVPDESTLFSDSVSPLAFPSLFDVDVPAPVVENVSFNDLVSYTLNNLPDGWTRIVVNTNNATLSDRNYAGGVYTEVSMSIKKSNSFSSSPMFSFTTQGIRIFLRHPLRLNLDVNEIVYFLPRGYNFDQNFGNSGVAPICTYGDSSGAGGTGVEYQIYGAYNGRNSPYPFQIVASYRGEALPVGSTADIVIFEDLEPVRSCDPRLGCLVQAPDGFSGVVGRNPDLGTPASRAGLNPEEIFARASYPISGTVRPVSNNIPFETSSDGLSSYGIGLIRVPSGRSFGRVFATVRVGEFKRSIGFYIGFISPLYLKMSASAPNPNGEDIANQYAYAYTIDPNKFYASVGQNASPVEDFLKPVADGTIVTWNLIKLRNAVDRPFYSTSNRSSGGYAIDKTVSGASNNVVFGPIVNVNSTLLQSGDSVILIPEEYIIVASVSYNGMTASVGEPICIYPNQISSDQVLPSVSQTSFYFAGKSFGKIDDYAQIIYADGEDYAVLEVIKDPRMLLGDDSDSRIEDIKSFCKCYNADGANSGISNAYLTVLPNNQLVEIKANKLPDCQSSGISPYIRGKIEILHGNSLSYFTDASGQLQVTSPESNYDTAIINTEENNRSEIAIRSNLFIPLKWGYYSKLEADPGVSSPVFCGDINTSSALNAPHNLTISASTSVIVNNSEMSVFSDGGMAAGNPPKMIQLIEPLYMQFAYAKKNGTILADSVIDLDGSSEYEFVFVAKFGKKPLPDGTQVKFYKCGSNDIVLSDSFRYTETRNETGFWSYGPDGDFQTSSASFVSIKVSPLSGTKPIFGSIFAEVNYDKKGDVFRQRVVGIDLVYIGGSSVAVSTNDQSSTGSGSNNTGNNSIPVGSGSSGNTSGEAGGSTFAGVGGGSTGAPPGSSPESSLFPFPEIVAEIDSAISRLLVNTAFSNDCYIYDTMVTDEAFKWRKIASMNLRRAMHSTEYIDGKLYSIGGLAGYGSDPSSALATVTLTDSVEKWDINDNLWRSARKSPHKRFGSLSCNDGRFIYVIGGFETRDAPVSANGLTLRRKVPYVSRRVERYDTLSDTWFSLSPMPVFDNDENQLNISADNLLLDRLGDELPNFKQYGVALGKAFVYGGKIIVLCGSRRVDSSMNTSAYNDRVIIYDIVKDEWSASTSLSASFAAQFCRNYPVVWSDADSLYISGGSSSIVENVNAQFGDEEFIVETTRTFALQNAFGIPLDVLNDLESDPYGGSINVSSIFKADYKFANLPKSRDQTSYGSVGLGEVYIFGGRVFAQGEEIGTNATRVAEKLFENADGKYASTYISKPSFGVSNSGTASDSTRLIYITGGITTNQSPGFVRLEIDVFGEQTEQINAEILYGVQPSDARVRLDGFSGVDIRVRAYDDEGELISGNLEVEINGLLAYGTGDEELDGGASIGSAMGRSRVTGRRRKRIGTRVYPIVVNPKNIICKNGIGYGRLEGRSEDILKSISEIQQILSINLDADERALGSAAILDLRQGLVRFPYRITLVGRVVDDYYFGKTSYVSTDPADNSIEIFLPENEVTDVVADAGEFGNATIIPPMLPAYASDRSPSPIAGLGPVLTVSMVGVIGPRGDSDLYKFIPQKSGLYIITVENRGFSTLKASVSIFTQDMQPYPIGGTANNVINFDGLGYGNIDQAIEFLAGFTYYFQLASYAAAENPDIEAVGAYDLRITIPIGLVQNDTANSTGDSNSSSSSSNNTGDPVGGSNSNSPVFDIFDYINDSVKKDLTDEWASILRSFYNSYFRLLISNGGYSDQTLSVAVQTISGIASCPFRCPVCVRRSGGDGSPTCGQGSSECSGSDNLVCVRFTGNGNLSISSSSSSSGSSSGDFTNPYSSDPNDPYGGESVNPIDLPSVGVNQFIIEDLTFESVDILASAIFSGSGSAPLSEGDSPIVQFYSDIDWIPNISANIFTGSDASIQFRKALRKIKQSVPFGSSPIYDGIEESAELMKKNFDADSIIKNVILISDNDENTSGNTPGQNIESINAIDGNKKVKFNAFNINTFSPVTISAQASRVNTGGVGSITNQTGGQNFALFSLDFLEDAAEFAFTGSAGSAGAGKLVLTIDFNENIIVNKVNPLIDIGSSDLITYSVSFGYDGEEFTNLPNIYDAGTEYVVNVKCRYLRITFDGILDFSKIEQLMNPYDPYSYGPIEQYSLSKIRGIGLNVSAADESFVYLNALPLSSSPQQVIIFVDWDGPGDASVQAGVSTVDSGDWKDFSRDAQPIIPGSGKVIIPIRSADKFGIIKENIKQISPFAFELPHGSVHRNLSLDIYDNNNEIVNPDSYEVDIDSGVIRFQSSMNGKVMHVAINENKLIKIGVKVSFGTSPNNVNIKSLGYMLNVNEDQAAQVANQPPIAISVRISPNIVYPYTNVSATYTYVDPEADVENKESRLIKWYKNGVEIPELRDIISYNDLHNSQDKTYSFFYTSNYANIEAENVGSSAEILANYAGERFFEPGDQIYFTIQVNDGRQYSNVFRSPSVVVSDYPAVPGALSIRARYAPISRTFFGNFSTTSGSAGSALFGQLASEYTNRTDLFLDYDLFSPGAFNAAFAKWYVTDNAGNLIFFKVGRLSDTSISASFLNPLERNVVTQFEAIMVGHQIYAEIFIPKGALPTLTSDTTIRSNTVTITNIVPTVNGVKRNVIVDANGGTPYWVFEYQLLDEDISQQEPNQSDRSIVRVYRKTPQDSTFSVDNRFNPLVTFPVKDLFNNGDTMYVEVVPYDGIAFGASVKSEEYLIT